MPRYLLHIEDNGIIEVVEVAEEKRPIEEVIFDHTFTMYTGTIYCTAANKDETESHWEADAPTDLLLVAMWADHLANEIKAQCL